MKKFTFTVLFFMILGSFTFGQYTAVLSTKTASPNENVTVNLDVTGFTSIASIQFYIQIDPAVLTYQSVTNFAQPGLLVNATGNNGTTITIIWTNTTPKNFPNGTLLTLNFKYNGLSSPVAFIPANCEVVKLLGSTPIPLTGTFTDGAVNPYMGNVAKAKLDSVFLQPLGAVTVPLKYTGFGSNVGSITQRIAYDPAKLSFGTVTGTGNLASGVNYSASNGIITITWTSVAGKNINYPGSMLSLNFIYNTAANTGVSFSTGCIIETTTPSNIPMTYYHGYVTPNVITSYAALGNVTGAVQGQTVDVPLNLTNMPSGTSNFNLSILYDNPRLSFIGIYNALQPVTSNVSGNHISITNTNPITASPSINGQFLVLRFRYDGVGTANVTFSTGCQFSIGNIPVGVGFTNGTVAPAVISGHNATISYVTAPNGPVAVPVTFSEMPTNVGSVQLFITYDATKLTFTGALNPYSALVKNNGNVVTVVWTSTTPPNLNNVAFVTLQFNYVAGSGLNCSAPVTFSDGCQLSTSGIIVPANWHDGGVNVKFKISGILKYDNPPLNTPLTGCTVKLMSGTNVVSTAVTNVSGYYEIMAVNGTYTLHAAPSATAGYFSDENDAQQIMFYAGGWGWPDVNPLRLYAGDVNQDGVTDENDAQLIYFRAGGWPYLPDWSLPDWVFGSIVNDVVKSVNVGCNDVPNTELYGLCSGNVTGSYIP